MRFAKFLAILVFSFSARAQYDLVLQGGHVIDPKNGIDQQMDVAISGGKIAAVASGIDAGKAKKVALTACMHKLLTIMNAMVRDLKRWQPREVPIA